MMQMRASCFGLPADDQVSKFAHVFGRFHLAHPKAHAERILHGDEEADVQQRVPLWNILCREPGAECRRLKEEIVESGLEAGDGFSLGHGRE